MSIIQITASRPTIGTETIFNIGGLFPIVNSFLMAFLITVIIAIISYFIFKTFKIIPSKFQSVIEIIYLRPDLADYLIVHELCHLGELNHSKKFWALVSKTIPDYIRASKELKKIHIKSV